MTKTNKEVAVAVAAPGEPTIEVTRIIDAPRDLVWAAFTDPVHAGRWWGPNGFTTTTKRMEVRAGGVWEFTMHGPDGRDWPNKITYREVVTPERLVYVHGDDGEDALFNTVVTFSADGERTRVHMIATFASVEERDRQAAEVGAVEGAAQHLDNMAAYIDANREALA
ncbi:MAG TPA: SRPBCC domain-containing protein [Rhizomicrobium sp.]|nr:SRPBCC domain-containing protein [Rhizomicrobium sp.]